MWACADTCGPIRPLLQGDGLSCVRDAPDALFGQGSGCTTRCSSCLVWRASPIGTFGLGHSRTSQYAASGCYSQTAARVYPTRVAVIRTVSKFMTNEPP
jgi:hypothetical protein